MAEYLVVWKIELDADSPEEAAKEARRIQLDPESYATVFDITKTDEMLTIDLEDIFGED